MTSFHSPSRPRSPAGRPFWLDSLIVLPTIDLAPCWTSENTPTSPLSAFRWRVRLMNGGNGRWYFCDLTPDELQIFLSDWKANPEKTFVDFFGTEEELPKGLGCGAASPRNERNVQVSEVEEELGF